MLDLAPETEKMVQDYAAREGISVNDLLARTFPGQAAPTSSVPSIWRSPTVDSGEAQRAAIHALLSMPKDEIIKRNAASIAFLEAELAVAENADPEEVAAADLEWAAHKRRIDANRAETGEQPVYREAGLSVR